MCVHGACPLDTLVVTPTHPFRVDGQGWTGARDLAPGDLVASADGRPLEVVRLTSLAHATDVYNLVVAEEHTYFVGRGGALVHNGKAKDPWDCSAGADFLEDLLTRGGRGAGDDASRGLPSVAKAVNSNMPHAIERAVERGIFPNAAEARAGLESLSTTIGKTGFPEGAILDTANADRVLVPVGEGGVAVYQVGANGTAKLKTVLNAL